MTNLPTDWPTMSESEAYALKAEREQHEQRIKEIDAATITANGWFRFENTIEPVSVRRETFNWSGGGEGWQWAVSRVPNVEGMPSARLGWTGVHHVHPETWVYVESHGSHRSYVKPGFTNPTSRLMPTYEHDSYVYKTRLAAQVDAMRHAAFIRDKWEERRRDAAIEAQRLVVEEGASR